MTHKEAILRIVDHNEIHSRKEKHFATHITEALNMAVKALKKQIPQKPLDDFSTHAIYDNDGNYLDQIDTMTFKCPICNHILARGEIETTDCAEIHYCDNCGQALDWNN